MNCELIKLFFLFVIILPVSAAAARLCTAGITVFAYGDRCGNQLLQLYYRIATSRGMVIIDSRVVINVTSVIIVVSLPYFRQRMVP